MLACKQQHISSESKNEVCESPTWSNAKDFINADMGSVHCSFLEMIFKTTSTKPDCNQRSRFSFSYHCDASA